MHTNVSEVIFSSVVQHKYLTLMSLSAFIISKYNIHLVVLDL